MKFIILKYSLALAVLFLVQWWVLFFSPLHIPEYIPYTPIKLNGFLLVGYMLTGLIVLQKALIKSEPIISVVKLTLAGGLMIFITEALFQVVRIWTEQGDKLYLFLRGISVLTLIGLIASFLSAFQLKTKRTGWLVSMIVVIGIIVNIVQYFFPEFK